MTRGSRAGFDQAYGHFLTGAACVLALACQPEDPTTSVVGPLAPAGAAGFGGGFAGAVGAGGFGIAGGMAPGAGAPAIVAGAGGSAGAPGYASGGLPGGGAAGIPAFAGGSAGVGGAAGAAYSMHVLDDCVAGEMVSATDGMLTGAPDVWTSQLGEVDLLLPKLVLSWMHDRRWELAHDAWHNVRKCKGGGPPPSSTAICKHTELVAAHQECTDAEDGYQFLATHRHMITHLKQAFPAHADLFKGFPHFPANATDVPQQWQSRWGTGWSSQIKSTAATLEDIEHHLDQFATDGDLGKYIQCGMMSSGASSIHGAMHFKWNVTSSPAALGKQTVDPDNYMFWKLHGWIDDVWERYRVAKGLTGNEPKLVEELAAQCREMHALAAALDPTSKPTDNTPLPSEHGFFHENVRPILERICSGCHSETSPEANMSLGGHISSADVVKGLVNQSTSHGGQFLRVVPGDPSHSWLYLKVSDMANAAGCQGALCNAQVMPPTGQVTLTAAELSAVSQWIQMGAPAPTN